MNLVGASHLVLYDIDWNPANDLQVDIIINIIAFAKVFKHACHTKFVQPRGLGRILETGCVKKNWVCEILASYARNSFIFASFASKNLFFIVQLLNIIVKKKSKNCSKKPKKTSEKPKKRKSYKKKKKFFVVVFFIFFLAVYIRIWPLSRPTRLAA